MKARRYERRGILALDPKALFEFFLVDDAPRENVEAQDAVIVDVRGPLEQHAHPWFDSYEAVASRVAAACEGSARAVILRFDSPGGDVAGCFDTANELREICARAGKELHALVDGDACSAAYALACAASTITITSTSLVGSIGVLSCREDLSQLNASRGIRVELITSGARKADGHPDAPITEAELAQTKSIVDGMANVFFELVAESRGLSVESVSQLEARVLHGANAVEAGLVDAVGNLSSVLALVAGVEPEPKDTKMTIKAKAKAEGGNAYEEARALLEKVAEGEDANAKAAKRALAALDAEGEPPPAKDDEPKDDDASAEGQAATSAEGEPPPAKDDEDKASAAAAYRLALSAQATAEKLRAELRQRDEAVERSELIASRPSLSAEMVELLKKAPIALVRETIAKTPEGGAPKLGAASSAAPTRGEDQGSGGVSRLPPAEKRALDERMGLVASAPGVRQSDYKLTLGVSPADGE